MTDLNDKQKEIIYKFIQISNSNEKKGILVQAGPWTWKTTLLVWLIETLINEENIKPEEVLVLSHTNSTLDTIQTKLEENWIAGVKIQTVASFFIENYLIPFKEYLKYNKKFLLYIETSLSKNGAFNKKKERKKYKDISTQDLIWQFLNKLWNNFSENNIESIEWEIFWEIINLAEENLLFFSNKILKGSGVKYILFDEYQDIEEDIGKQLEFFIKSNSEIKFLIVWDKNQAIIYNNSLWDLNSRWNELWLEKDSLDKTYRFWKNIWDKLDKICDDGSEINKYDKWESGIYEIINYNPENIDYKSQDKFWVNGILNLLKEKWENNLDNLDNLKLDNLDNLKWKNICILFQPTTDRSFWENLNKKIKNKLSEWRFDFINFIRTEKPFHNPRLSILIRNLIKWIEDKTSISYSKVEEQLNYFIEKDKKIEIFNKLLNIRKDSLFNELSFLLEYFREGRNNFNEILSVLWNEVIWEIDYNKIEKIHFSEEKINLYTSPIHSAKGKEWDIVVILDVYNDSWNWKTFSEVLQGNEVAKNIYYVAVSRAKEWVYTFVRFNYD